MGRKSRKRQRQREQSRGGGYRPYDDPVAQGPSDPFLFAQQEPMPRLSTLGDEPRAATTCDSCKEFVLDGDAGRGTCLHPASGILSPWTATPSCPFYDPQMRVRRGDDRHIW